MDSATGRLEQKNVVPLSLSATAPRDLAVSPDGCSLIVAVHGGGAYNLLRIEEDGQLGKVSSILKEIGSGPHPSQSAAHPAAVVFDRAGRVLAADQGSDRLSVLSIDRGALGVAGRWELAAGSGPTGMVLHPHGEQVYVAHALNGSISAFSYDATGALHQNWTVHVQAAGDVAELAMHPSGELLFSTHGTGVQAWKAAADGDLEPLSINRQVKARKLYAMPDCDSLLVLTDDAVLRMKIDVQRGVLADPVVMASLPQPLSIAAL
jgi:6-phosphogluconolactonase (cycloisomerase 2 family)